MDKRWRQWAKNNLAHFGQEFEPKLVLEDDNFFIMDWRDKNGSGNLATRYIVDKKKGDLIIKGDAGDCIASWYNEVKVEDLVHYINSTGYFMEKMQCTTNKYTYRCEDVENDLEEIRQKYLQLIKDGEFAEDITEEEAEEDFYEMQLILDDMVLTERTAYPSKLIDLMSKYDSDWWESDFSRLGERIDKRIYLWTYGFQEGVERLRGEQYVRKDI